MTLAELYRELERHDWFYAMSEDPGVYARGQEQWSKLEHDAYQIEGGPELFKAYIKHVFSGEGFGTVKEPKPEMPKEPCQQCNGRGWYAYGETDKPEQRQCEACGTKEKP